MSTPAPSAKDLFLEALDHGDDKATSRIAKVEKKL